VPPSDLAGAGMRRHVHSGNHAAESFVSCIRLFGSSFALRMVRGRALPGRMQLSNAIHRSEWNGTARSELTATAAATQPGIRTTVPRRLARVDSELRSARRLAEERGVRQPHRRLSSPLTDATSDSVRRLPTNPGPERRERLRWTRSVLGQLAYVDGRVASPIHPHVCRTLAISCEAVTPPVSPAGAQGGTLPCRSGAALSFVSCIRLLGRAPTLREANPPDKPHD
jgi:hypothetical protein